VIILTANDYKKVFILGDEIEDLVLVRNFRNSDVSPSYDLFTENQVEKHQLQSGIRMLKELLSKSGVPISNLDVVRNGKIIETISEWKKQDVEHKERLFLKDQLGLLTRDISQEQQLEKQTQDAVMAIYNITNNEYPSNIMDGLKECFCVVLRTRFDSQRGSTLCLKCLCKNDERIKKTVLLFNVNELRRGGFNVPNGVSWEQIVAYTIRSLKDIPHYNEFKAIVVCFNYEGCLVIINDLNNSRASLFFYPGEMEGDHVLNSGHHVFGSMTTMQASLTRALSLCKGQNEFENQLYHGVKCGLEAMRKLVDIGFSSKAEFPYSEITQIISTFQNSNDLATFQIDNYAKLLLNEATEYTIIGQIIKDLNNKETLASLCKQIITNGKPSDNAVPFLRYGELITYDKLEIEQLRNTRYLFRSYINGDLKMTTPLSICVFGPPGSGKSFAVKQIAAINEIIHIGDKTPDKVVLEFNVSQMDSKKDLTRAFQQIRDVKLKGNMPIVFFDEFDSTVDNAELYWLKYFLAPMQDGKFTDEGFTHDIGTAIFIFAGGTHTCMDEFKEKVEKVSAEKKAGDFLSRLRGYIDILGPNSIQCPHGGQTFRNNSEKCRRFAEEYEKLMLKDTIDYDIISWCKEHIKKHEKSEGTQNHSSPCVFEDKLGFFKKQITDFDYACTTIQNINDDIAKESKKFAEIEEKMQVVLKEQTESTNKLITATQNVLNAQCDTNVVENRVEELKLAQSVATAELSAKRAKIEEVRGKKQQIQTAIDSKKDEVDNLEKLKKQICNDLLEEVARCENISVKEFEEAINKIRQCKHKREFCQNIHWYKRWNNSSNHHKLRRATLLRSILERKLLKNDKKATIGIDDAVLNAFMMVDTYLYGARSLEAIVQTSNITKKHYSVQCINTNSLELYVDASFTKHLFDKKTDLSE